jgi:hypothetical protein
VFQRGSVNRSTVADSLVDDTAMVGHAAVNCDKDRKDSESRSAGLGFIPVTRTVISVVDFVGNSLTFEFRTMGYVRTMLWQEVDSFPLRRGSLRGRMLRGGQCVDWFIRNVLNTPRLILRGNNVMEIGRGRDGSDVGSDSKIWIRPF